MNLLNDPREPTSRGPAAYLFFLAAVTFFVFMCCLCGAVVAGWM